MLHVADIIRWLEALAPLELAEEWDNVGLLLGDPGSSVERVVTCLTLTPDVAQEAVDERAQLIVAHHPILFRPVQRVTSESSQGRMILALARAGIAVYAPHTAYDSSALGVNQQLAELFGLRDVAPIRQWQAGLQFNGLGSGRLGNLPASTTLHAFCELVKRLLKIDAIQFAGDRTRAVSRVAIACGSAAEFLPDAHRLGCDVLLTGEARFHACLEAVDLGIALVLAGHYATERPAIEHLATLLRQQFQDLDARASQCERDPVQSA